MKLVSIVLGGGAGLVGLGWLGWALSQDGREGAAAPPETRAAAESNAEEPVNLFPPLEVAEEPAPEPEEPAAPEPELLGASSGPGWERIEHPDGIVTGSKKATMTYGDGTVREVDLSFRAKRVQRPLALVKRGPDGQREVLRPGVHDLQKEQDGQEPDGQ